MKNPDYISKGAEAQTLEELLRAVESVAEAQIKAVIEAGGKRPKRPSHCPSVKSFKEEDIVAVGKDFDATVYSSGFAVYRSGGHQVVIRMEKVERAVCREYHLKPADIAGISWELAVSVAGEKKIEENYNAKCRKYHISISGGGYRDDEFSEAGDMELNAGVNIEAVYLRQELTATIAELLTGLAPLQEQVISMIFYEKMSEREIAAVLGKSRSTVKQAKAQGLNNLKKALGELELDT